VQDMAKLDSVAMGAVDGRAHWRLLGPGGAEFTVVSQPRYVADDLLTLKSAVMQGIGMTMLPYFLICDALSKGTLVEVLPGWAPETGMVHAVFPSRRGLMPAVRRFLDFLGEHIDGEEMLPGTGAGACPETAPAR